MNPVLICIPDNSLRSRTYNQFLLELSCWVNLNTALILLCAQAVVCYHSTLLSKTLNVLGLFREERLWDEQWEVCVLCTSFLKHLVELLLHLLPDSVTIRLNYHTATYSTLLCQVGLNYQVVKPLTVVIGSFR